VNRPETSHNQVIEVYLADANVLYSRVLRDYLLYAMRARLISVVWSQRILFELTEHLMDNRPNFSQASADRLIRAMNTTFPYAQRDPDSEQFALLAGIELPDEDDRHIIAAAIAADAPFICTHNVKDFPSSIMVDLGLTVVTPDDLLCQLIQDYQQSMLWVHRASVDSLRGATDESTVLALRQAGASQAARLMAHLVGLL
jgi:predicted nucleic acid-binding protein